MLYRKWGSNNDEVIKYTSSINSDKEIFQEVKLVMKAHVIELYLDKIINKEISKKILDAINNFNELPEGYEDIHEALEDFIINNVGEDGGWIGLARSRNDHVATALRLKMRGEIIDILESIIELRTLLIEKSKIFKKVLFPSYTHFQPAQPTTFSHYMLYIEEELSARWNILFSILKIINRSPLGSGAIVGTNIAINRNREAELLGFDNIIINTISATSSRSDLISSISEITNLMVSMSRIAEDMILLSSSFTGYVKIPDSQVSTSSLMPQKRNAVTMEILRSKGGECIGILTSIMSIYKGIPSGYDLDLQEINKNLWNCIKIVKSSLEVLKDLFNGIEILNKDIDKSTLATDEAEKIANEGKPYRKAYFDVADKVMHGSFSPIITLNESIEHKSVSGSPNPKILEEDLRIIEKRLNLDKLSLNEYKTLVVSKMGQLRVIEDDIMQEGL